MFPNLEGPHKDEDFMYYSDKPRFLIDWSSYIRGRHAVFHAHDLKRDRPVVIKVATLAQVKAELRIYTRLDDVEGIPKIYNWCEWPGQPYFSFMCMTRGGENLATFIHKRGCLSLKDASRVAITILGILSLVHSRGVVHCDIKPENIVCSSDGRIDAPMLVDWELAVIPSTKDRKTFAGTPGYSSVSYLSGDAPHPLDDIESLVYLVEFLHMGRLPWSHLMRSKNINYNEMLELQEPWVPENVVLQEFLRYTRDRRAARPTDYDHLRELLLKVSDSIP